VWIETLDNIDLDGDGTIDFDEFFVAAIDHHKVITKENLKIAFDVFDINGDGQIDISEFKHSLPSSSFEEENSIGNSQWATMMKSVDKDEDGIITFKEFCDAIESFIPGYMETV
jgi:calcium-dependent protein kinase